MEPEQVCLQFRYNVIVIVLLLEMVYLLKFLVHL